MIDKLSDDMKKLFLLGIGAAQGAISGRSGGSARSTNVTINQTNNFSGSSPSPSAIRAATKGAAQTLLKY